MSRDPIRILVVEDDEALREALLDTALMAGLAATGAADGSAALARLKDERFDLVISDIQMAPMDGHALLREIRAADRELPVVLMTAHESIQSAVDALRDGATDYLIKPFEAEVLLGRLDTWLPQAPALSDDDVIAVDPVSQQVYELARRVAQSDASVMITGESGVGKEVVFRTIHAHSPRAAHDAVAINCAAIPENMLEAVLFGYEKGAFTGAYKACPGKFEQAHESSLLLDEISEMPLALQAKLLRVLQERQVERLGSNRVIDLDVRIVATSNRDLREEVAAGRFREDLYYRLNVLPLSLPSLRERREDIPELTEHFLGLVAAREGVEPCTFDENALAAMQAYHWPGNVRELQNVCERAAVLAPERMIRASLVLPWLRGPAPASTPVGSMIEAKPGEGDPMIGSNPLTAGIVCEDGLTLETIEREIIVNTLKHFDGHRRRSAKALGIGVRTLGLKLKKWKEESLVSPDL